MSSFNANIGDFIIADVDPVLKLIHDALSTDAFDDEEIIEMMLHIPSLEDLYKVCEFNERSKRIGGDPYFQTRYNDVSTPFETFTFTTDEEDKTEEDDSFTEKIDDTSFIFGPSDTFTFGTGDGSGTMLMSDTKRGTSYSTGYSVSTGEDYYHKSNWSRSQRFSKVYDSLGNFRPFLCVKGGILYHWKDRSSCGKRSSYARNPSY